MPNQLGARVVLCACLMCPTVATGQVNLAATVGAVQYDFANDDNYLVIGLQVRYYATPVVRVGFMGGTAHIGDPPNRSTTLDGTDERMWRGAAFLEVATRPLSKVSGSLRGFVGVFHSSGVILEPRPPDAGSWYGITDTPTGVTYGGGIGVEVGPFSRLRFLLQANLWMDHAYSGSPFDPEAIFGLGVDL